MKHLERLDSKLQIINSSLLSNYVCAENEHKFNTELIKQSKPNKITITAEIKWQRLREKRCKHKDNTRCVIEEETKAVGIKPLCHPPSGK